MNSNTHVPVLLNECIEHLNIKSDGCYVDMTLGRGGHSKFILDRLGEFGRVIAIDQDDDAIDFCRNKFKSDNRITIIKNNFCNLRKILNNLNINYVDGILIDLGVSSPQLDNPDRGFSYRLDGPLDMRMDPQQNLSAKDIVNNFSFEKLNKIFRNYGEINNPLSVSKNIIRYRTKFGPITRTLQLVKIIETAIVKKELLMSKHFARKYFQALRIAVNDELNILKKTIEIAAHCLKPNGVLEIISFHSLEDKIVINSFKELSKNKLPKEVPINNLKYQEFKIKNIRPIVPDNEELLKNSRARSSKLRILTKC